MKRRAKAQNLSGNGNGQLLLFGAEHWLDWPEEVGYHWVSTPLTLSIEMARINPQGEMVVCPPFHTLTFKKRKFYWGNGVQFLKIPEPRTKPFGGELDE